MRTLAEMEASLKADMAYLRQQQIETDRQESIDFLRASCGIPRTFKGIRSSLTRPPTASQEGQP